MQKVLITGIAGFVGSHLAESLSKRAEVWGAYIGKDLSNLEGVEGLRLVECDLLDAEKVRGLIKEIRPDRVFHLAAQSVPSASFSDPARTLQVNIFSTLNLFEAVIEHAPEAVVLNIGSGDEYGEVDASLLPVKETAELKPINPYAVSKVTQDLLAFQYSKSKGLKVVRCRPFNHYGPRQSDTFVCSSFARQVAGIEAGVLEDKVIKVGNLEAAKDFLHVGDVVRAYELLIEKGGHGSVYNVCSGHAVKIRRIVETLISLSDEKIGIEQDMSKKRLTDTVALYGDASRLKALGWSPETGLEEGLSGLLAYWRKRV
ncbi:MAG: GDP-mannose 4,6-dehydratase [Deltaproteobacteria bacterium]|nr:GDP-mannose 4,6-dehydratase [Deltaproteobacteria bacterium]